jgi:hypothetical protein
LQPAPRRPQPSAAKPSSFREQVKPWQLALAAALAVVLLGVFANVVYDVGKHPRPKPVVQTVLIESIASAPRVDTAVSMPLDDSSRWDEITVRRSGDVPPPPVVWTRAWDRIVERHAVESVPNAPQPPLQRSSESGEIVDSVPTPGAVPAVPLDPVAACSDKHPFVRYDCKLRLCKKPDYRDHEECRTEQDAGHR